MRQTCAARNAVRADAPPAVRAAEKRSFVLPNLTRRVRLRRRLRPYRSIDNVAGLGLIRNRPPRRGHVGRRQLLVPDDVAPSSRWNNRRDRVMAGPMHRKVAAAGPARRRLCPCFRACRPITPCQFAPSASSARAPGDARRDHHGATIVVAGPSPGRHRASTVRVAQKRTVLAR